MRLAGAAFLSQRDKTMVARYEALGYRQWRICDLLFAVTLPLDRTPSPKERAFLLASAGQKIGILLSWNLLHPFGLSLN
jgi:hypothetical protein